MSSTLVGMFDDKASADRAQQQLAAAGIEAATTAADERTVIGGGSHKQAESGMDPANRSGVSRFNNNLFGGDTADTSDSHAYQEAFRRGHYGLTVHAKDDSELDSAEQILNAAGAVDIDESAKSWSGWQGAPAVPGQTAAGDGAHKLALMEEKLKVGKREVTKGAVRVYSRIVKSPVEDTIKLRQEHATIERTAVDRPATEADFTAFKEGTTDVHEMAEEAVVSKTARVVVEVNVGKQTTEHAETIHESLRTTEVNVDQTDASDI